MIGGHDPCPHGLKRLVGRLARKVGPFVSAAVTSSALGRAAGAARELARRASRQPHRVLYFHQTDDPYSHLAAQLLSRFRENFDVELDIHLVPAPDDAAAPERDRLIAYSRKDAADVAPYYGLEFEDRGRQPEEAAKGRAERILASALRSPGAEEVLAEVGSALWAGDEEGLAGLATEYGEASGAEAGAVMAGGDTLRRKLGHYLGATFYHGGRWYWGADRLHYLEWRLECLGRRRRGPGFLVEPPPVQGQPGVGRDQTLEFFGSLRSPYTAIAMGRVLELAERSGVELRIRPVLPMVMRGLPVPKAKRMYILRDVKREADRLGIPFGRISDPVGRPVERALAVYPLAVEQGLEAGYLTSFFEQVWAHGVDAGTDRGLRRIVEAAGLSWPEARRRLGRDEWRTDAEDNRRAMFEMGLWGVPSFRLSGPGDHEPFCTWGQDRLWLIEATIARRAAVATAARQRV